MTALRDGGYYNNWIFEHLIKEYLNAIAKTSINFVEIGLRTTLNKGFKGAWLFQRMNSYFRYTRGYWYWGNGNASDLGSNSEHLKS